MDMKAIVIPGEAPESDEDAIDITTVCSSIYYYIFLILLLMIFWLGVCI